MVEGAQLIHFDTARRALALATSIDEVKQIRDQAEAIRHYIRQQKGSFEMQNQAAEIKLRAERRAGEMLREQEKNKGAMGIGVPFHDDTAPTYEELNITRLQAHRWQLEAEMPEETFEQFIAEMKTREEELTSRGVLTIALKIRRQRQIQNVPDLPPGKFQVIYADPPWAYDNAGLGGSAESHYPTMSMEELLSRKEDIESRAADSAVLFLWVTNSFLPEGLELCQEWGFEYKTSFIWIKDRSTYGKLGFYNYGQHEFLFVATRGSCLPRSSSLVSSVIVASKEGHSAKPELVYEIIEAMYPGPYLELFARNKRANWEAWGTL